MWRLLRQSVVIIIVAATSIAVALLVTPMQTVHTAGQTIRVGAAAPTLSLSGPGRLDLFGQQLPTTIDFVGPVRPRIQLTHITLSQQLADLVGEPADAGGDGDQSTEALQEALVDGWVRYLAWQVVIAGGVTLLLLGAIAGWRRSSARNAVTFVAIGLVFTQAVNLGAIMITAYTAPDRLRQVTSLQALVGATPSPALPVTHDPARTGHIVVIGDSIAAGLGNPPLPNPSADDVACRRSVDSFANTLAVATDWTVTNLACSGATIREGLLGPQTVEGRTLDPQLPSAVMRNPSAIIVNIGANDVEWSALLRVCAVVKKCDNAALEAWFQQQLADFARSYFVLLTRLRSLPDPPVVVVNQYYNPLGGDLDCVASKGITDAKREWLVEQLGALNTVLAAGAEASDFVSVKPNFTGHALCSAEPYLYGVDSPAAFHPTTAGALAIALADQAALHNAGIK